MNLLDIHVEHCRARQKRLLAVMQRLRLDLVVVGTTEHVQWLAGPRFAWYFEPAAALAADGRLTLVAPGAAPSVTASDEIIVYPAQHHATLRNDQRRASSEVLLEALGRRAGPKRLGVEFSALSQHLAAKLVGSHGTELVDIDPELYVLRRHKHPDELARIRKAIAGTAAMYARAREMIEPGVNELDLFNELQAAAVREFGEPLTGTGNDYRCGAPGGQPSNRAAADGELYILDLGPAYRGYFADNCRTLAVNRRPTDAQQRAWEQIVGVFALVQRMVKPGARCRDLFAAAQAHLDLHLPGGFNHHLGHGIGLFPHEAPHLNPNWDDVFEEGEVFTAEPGLYGPELRAGIRLENNYLVTATGVELLSDFSLEL
jgi:Xaa-Pro aminopeptidase